jgi:hypothetical protein
VGYALTCPPREKCQGERASLLVHAFSPLDGVLVQFLLLDVRLKG